MKTNEELLKINKDEEDFKSLTQEERTEYYSLKIFGKNSKDIRYLLVTNFIHQQLLDEEISRTGLYQWLNVFKGDIKYPRDVADYNEYDIVQVNMSPQDVNLVSTIREQIGENSKTKLILNNDFTAELWGLSFDYPETIGREISSADMLFGTEYFQTTALSELSGRKCYVIPHPADVKRLKSLTPKPKQDIISTIWRRYDNYSYVPSLAVRNHGLTTRLIGFDKNIDKRVYLTTTLFDYVLAGTNYFDFCSQMSESKIVYNPFTFHSYDRSTIDCAAMGVAVIGSNRTQSMNVCYPHTIVNPYDVTKTRQLIKRLLEDEKFYDLVVRTAQEQSEFYSHKNSRERYLASLDDSIEVGRERKRTVIKKKSLTKGTGEDVLLLKSQELNR